MNPAISVLFRAIPLAMGRSASRSGSTCSPVVTTSDHFVAGHVLVALTAICIALFTTAATIIRQLIDRYGPGWVVALPVLGYTVSLATMIWGVTIIARGDESKYVVAGHVTLGIGFVAACVSTVATASTEFVLIQKSEARPVGGGAPDGAYSRRVGEAFVAIPAHVLVGLGAVCFTLYSIVSILEAGTSKE